MRKKKSWNWPAIILSVILISSTFAVIFYGIAPNNETKKFNGFKFTQAAGSWQTPINNNQLFFNYLPEDVQSIALDPILADKLRSSPEIDATSSINDSNGEAIAVAESQMEQILNQVSQIYLRRGFDTNTSYGLPVIICNATKSPEAIETGAAGTPGTAGTAAVPILYIRTGLETSIKQEGSCIVAQGQTAQDIIKLKDRILYGIYGILP